MFFQLFVDPAPLIPLTYLNMAEINPKKADIYDLTRIHDLYDRENPRALINVAPDVVKAGLEHSSVRLYMKKDEESLKKIVKPTPTLNRLRQRFWLEFDLSQDQKRDMIETNIWMGICSLDLYLNYMEKYKYQAWILMPLPKYEDIIEEALTAGLNRIREIFEFPLYEKKSFKQGNESVIREVPNYKAADLMLKTVKMLDDRAKGGVVQKIESRVTQENRNLHLHASTNDGQKNSEHSKDLIEQEIKRLEQKLTGNKSKVVEAEIIDGISRKIEGPSS